MWSIKQKNIINKYDQSHKSTLQINMNEMNKHFSSPNYVDLNVLYQSNMITYINLNLDESKKWFALSENAENIEVEQVLENISDLFLPIIIDIANEN